MSSAGAPCRVGLGLHRGRKKNLVEFCVLVVFEVGRGIRVGRNGAAMTSGVRAGMSVGEVMMGWEAASWVVREYWELRNEDKSLHIYVAKCVCRSTEKRL